MRTNIEIDDRLLRRAMELGGFGTKKAAVEAALQLVVRLDRQSRAIQQLWGIGWEGNLEEMRASRFPDWDRGSENELPDSNRSVA
jgi:Arc/MetJ family transcription regulator